MNVKSITVCLLKIVESTSYDKKKVMYETE